MLALHEGRKEKKKKKFSPLFISTTAMTAQRTIKKKGALSDKKINKTFFKNLLLSPISAMSLAAHRPIN